MVTKKGPWVSESPVGKVRVKSRSGFRNSFVWIARATVEVAFCGEVYLGGEGQWVKMK